MTAVVPAPREATPGERPARPRRYLMCRPDHFEVSYAINPWMDIARPVDRELAIAQWEALRQTYLRPGSRGGRDRPRARPARHGLRGERRAWSSRGGRSAPGSRTRSAAPRGRPTSPGSARAGLTDVVEPVHANEGEGDFLVVGELVLAGTGFRTDPGAHDEVQEFFGVPVISLQLVDPRFYHLDTALAVLDDHRRGLLPGGVQRRQPRRARAGCSPTPCWRPRPTPSSSASTPCPTATTSCCPRPPSELVSQLRARGYEPVGVDLSELLKAGGSVKCCTMEIRS